MAGRRYNVNGAALLMQGISILFLIFGLLVQDILSGSHPGYGTRRWGLLLVSGRKSMYHHAQADVACTHRNDLSMGVACLSPLCRHYDLKCNAWNLVIWTSYGSFAVVAVLTTFVVLSAVVSLRKNVNSQRLAAMISLVCSGALFATLFIYTQLMNAAFAMINSGPSKYSVPQPGSAFILCSVAALMLAFSSLAHMSRYKSLKRESEFVAETRQERKYIKEKYNI